MIFIILVLLTIGINSPFMPSVSLFRPRTCLSCENFGIQLIQSLQSETQQSRGELSLVLLGSRQQGKRGVCQQPPGCIITWRWVSREFPPVRRISLEHINVFDDHSV